MGNLTSLEPTQLTTSQSTEVAMVEAREAQMIQGMIVSARKFPRDETKAFANIMRACERPTMASTAIYSFPRGGQEVTGPSIRLAQVIKQSWGNMRSGWREQERLPGRSKVYTVAWDLETNSIDDIEFIVEHVRERRSGPVALTDPRDIYEMVANLSRRRERSNILAIVPGDIVEAATEKCKETLAKTTDLKKAVPQIIEAFAKYDIVVEQIEAKLRRKIASIGHSQYVQLRSIFQSLKDGMSEPSDWFESLHDPMKIKKESEAAAKEVKTNPAQDEKFRMDQARKQAITEFEPVFAKVKEMGGDPEKMLGVTAESTLKLGADEINAGTDILQTWINERVKK